MERACNSFNGEIISVTIYSNTELRKFCACTSKVLVLTIFSNMFYFAVCTITLSLKALGCGD